jgi:hypothetical protein
LIPIQITFGTIRIFFVCRVHCDLKRAVGRQCVILSDFHICILIQNIPSQLQAAATNVPGASKFHVINEYEFVGSLSLIVVSYSDKEKVTVEVDVSRMVNHEIPVLGGITGNDSRFSPFFGMKIYPLTFAMVAMAIMIPVAVVVIGIAIR